MSERDALLQEVRRRRWFYEFQLPDGTRTESYLHDGIKGIHDTRQQMLDAVLDQGVRDCAGLTAVDLACTQGGFALNLARRGFREVLGVDARPSHLDDATLMAKVLGETRFVTRLVDLEAARPADIGEHDVTLMLGLLYHIENPVRLLRLARAITRRVLIVESQVMPHMGGMVEWGAEEFRRPLEGIFGIIDESAEVQAGEASVHGICLAPSAPALAFLLARVGFSRVVPVVPPPDGYEQLVRRRRVMFAAFP